MDLSEPLYRLTPQLIAAIRASQKTQAVLGRPFGLVQPRVAYLLAGRPFGGRKTYARVLALGASLGLTPIESVEAVSHGRR